MLIFHSVLPGAYERVAPMKILTHDQPNKGYLVRISKYVYTVTFVQVALSKHYNPWGKLKFVKRSTLVQAHLLCVCTMNNAQCMAT